MEYAGVEGKKEERQGHSEDRLERQEEKLQDVLKAKRASYSEANTNQKKMGVSQ